MQVAKIQSFPQFDVFDLGRLTVGSADRNMQCCMQGLMAQGQGL